MIINAVSACWSSYSYANAIRLIHEGTVEPIFGKLAHEHVQLCPQHENYLSEEVINELMSLYPSTQFRLHADVRLKNKRGVTIDLIDFKKENFWYFKKLAEFSDLMNAPLYSLHAGLRERGDVSELIEKAHQIQEFFNCPVAVEGHYPFRNRYLISTWKEYEEIYLSGVPFALDLSHLNIVAHRSGWDYDLTQEMLSSINCKEVHLSFNNGVSDSHYLSLDENKEQWEIWKPMVEKANKEAVIFSEGNQVLHLMKQQRLKK